MFHRSPLALFPACAYVTAQLSTKEAMMRQRYVVALLAAPLAGAPAGPDPTQVLDLLIAKLRTMVDEKAAPKAPPTGAYRVELVPVPRGHG